MLKKYFYTFALDNFGNKIKRRRREISEELQKDCRTRYDNFLILRLVTFRYFLNIFLPI